MIYDDPGDVPVKGDRSGDDVVRLHRAAGRQKKEAELDHHQHYRTDMIDNQVPGGNIHVEIRRACFCRF